MLVGGRGNPTTGKSNRKRKKNEHWLPKQPKRPHLEENTLTEITIGK
jgi:hypothetical protein